MQPKSKHLPQAVIDQNYLDFRHDLLAIAATLDRYQRAVDSQNDHTSPPQWQRCKEALVLLTQDHPQPNRAEQLALLFSKDPKA